MDRSVQQARRAMQAQLSDGTAALSAESPPEAKPGLFNALFIGKCGLKRGRLGRRRRPFGCFKGIRVKSKEELVVGICRCPDASKRLAP